MKVGEDPRPIMREAYNMFKNGGEHEKARFNAIHLKDIDSFYLTFMFPFNSAHFEFKTNQTMVCMVAYNTSTLSD